MTNQQPNWLTKLQGAILGKLNQGHRPEVGQSNMYQGTVEGNVKAKRRAKNKMARKSRQINRRK